MISAGLQISNDLDLCLAELSPSQIFVLTDDNSLKYCLPLWDELMPLPYTSITVSPGESSKSWDTTHQILLQLHEHHADRHSLLIGLGGGVITDLAGFCASLYHRGISCIHFPTTLTAMCDAAIGGKNGINLRNNKNQIGTFYPVKGIFIQDSFLHTLNKRELKSGMVELLKTLYLMQQPISLDTLSEEVKLEQIVKAARYKLKLTEEDMFDRGDRRFLNIGHTIGHALEVLFTSLSHGEAVLLGLYYEHLFAGAELQAKYFKSIIQQEYSQLLSLSTPDINELVKPMLHDKKNNGSQLHLPFLSDVFAWETLTTEAKSLARKTIEHWLQ